MIWLAVGWTVTIAGIVVTLQTWQLLMSVFVLTTAVAGTLYSAASYSVRYVRRYVLEAANALDARRHADLIALRNDILEAMDRTTPGVGTFDDVKEADLGANGGRDTRAD